MIRFTLLQARLQIILALLGLTFVGLVLALTTHDVTDATKQCANYGACDSVIDALPAQVEQLYARLYGLVLVTPGIIGVFWGAPLASREFDTATYRLAWTQSVTRTRWIITKLACLGLVAISITAVLSWMVSKWAHPIDTVNSSLFFTFDARDIAPVAHTAFAFVVGVTVGLFAKRVVPSMVITLVVVVACSVGGPHVRPYLATPHTLITPVRSESLRAVSYTEDDVVFTPTTGHMPNTLVISTKFIDRRGKLADTLRFDVNEPGSCADFFPRTRRAFAEANPAQDGAIAMEAKMEAKDRCYSAVAADYDVRVVYQPASRYWTLQWIESGLYFALALVLGAMSVAYLRRHSA